MFTVHILTVIENTYTYLSVEFDKKVVDAVVRKDDTFEIIRHDSLSETDQEKGGVTLKDCLDSFTSNENLGMNDTW